MTELMALIAILLLFAGFIAVVAGVKHEESWLVNVGILFMSASLLVGSLAYCMSRQYLQCWG